MSKAPTDYDELVADNRRLRLNARDLIASRERCRKALQFYASMEGGESYDGGRAASEALARIDEKVEPK